MGTYRIPVSDTVTVTADGRTIVDVQKLFAKSHIQKMMRDMKAKTRFVNRKSRKKDDLVPVR